MSLSAFRVHARPSRTQLIRTRLCLYLRTATGLQLTVGGLLGPPALWLMWRAFGEQPWPSSNNFIFVVAPAAGLGVLALSVFGGLSHPRTITYLHEGAEYTLSEDGFVVRNSMAQARVAWAAITQAIEFRELFVLLAGAEQHLLPKADFTPGDEDAFRKLVRERLGKRASLSA